MGDRNTGGRLRAVFFAYEDKAASLLQLQKRIPKIVYMLRSGLRNLTGIVPCVMSLC